MAVLADGRHTPETAIQRYDYDIDSDDDGLIEIRNLDMFNNINFNFAGTTYDDEAADSGTGDIGITTGGPTSATTVCRYDWDGDGVFLCGYELMGNLDFALASSYASGTVNATWCPDTSNNCIGNTSQAGFPGIAGPAAGDSSGFTGIFEGNGNSISNFYSRNTANTNDANIGLFAVNRGRIRNIAVEANVFGGTNNDRIGGLVGYNIFGIITAGSASGNADGAGGLDYVGGLVGYHSNSEITASYAIGSAEGGGGLFNRVGGLVGSSNNSSSITASYATGNADGGVGGGNYAGGLVGYNNGSSITASYATGDVDGGNGLFDRVGGLVGENRGSITASYATGIANGGAGTDDYAGGLVGDNALGTITESYSFGTPTGGENGGNNGTARPSGVSAASNLTTGNAGASWNNAGVWNFGTTSQNPALIYNNTSCSNNGGYSSTIPGITTTLTCGTTLVGNFRAP